ncbi:hypothetical protein [Streptomyces sp. H72]
MLDTVVRDPRSCPPFDARDPADEDVHAASIGTFTALYFINRSAVHL